jgi:hypothetical protein
VVEHLGRFADHEQISVRGMGDVGQGVRRLTGLADEPDRHAELVGPVLGLVLELRSHFYASLLDRGVVDRGSDATPAVITGAA